MVEVGPTRSAVPLPRGHWPGCSNYPAQHLRAGRHRGGLAPPPRRAAGPAAPTGGWPRRPDGRRLWTFHSLRHVFATWALAQPGARIEDVSRLMGHSTVRVTQDLYISADGDLFDRFYRATQ